MVVQCVNMIEAKKNRLFEKLFSVYNSNLLRRKFDAFHVANLQHLDNHENVPQILVANHTGWWDGLVVFELSMRARLDGYVMMEERQLRRFWPFTRLGAFSVVRENPRSALRSVNYASELLKNPARSLWIFPQGELVPFGTRPMKLFPGFARIAETVGRCRLVTMSIRYEFMKAHRPSIAVRIDSPFTVEVAGRLGREELIDRVAANLITGEDDLELMMKSGIVTSEFVDILK
jgi:chlorobactene lauroyltransferase